nr:hypothetical protein CFP56_78449 [Quercus suber]
MKLLVITAVLHAASLVYSSLTMDVPADNEHIAVCHSQGCGDCVGAVGAMQGYPGCVVHDSASALGQDFASSSGHGYDVWWSSLAPDPMCSIIIRTPASTDVPGCGYYLTSWEEAGCYYTAILESFIVQYCCGAGDCDAAAPAASIADAHSQAALGNTTILSLAIEKPNISGKRSVEGGCSLTASATITEGQTINPMLGATVFQVVSAGVGYSFTESMSYGVSTKYMQVQGTTGYMSYIPTLNCWDGKFSDCVARKGNDLSKIDPSQVYHACTPALRVDGRAEGTFSFVYTN